MSPPTSQAPTHYSVSTPWNACSWDATEQPQAAGIAIKYKIAKMDMKFDTDAMRGAGLAVFVM
jgi:hypothetical protein